MFQRPAINSEKLIQQLSQEGRQTLEKMLSIPAITKEIDQAWPNHSIAKIRRQQLAELVNKSSPSDLGNDHSLHSIIFLSTPNQQRVPFCIGEKIAIGGNAVIKQAYNLETGTCVALKIDRGFGNKDTLTRQAEFELEKQVLIDFAQSYHGMQIRESNQPIKYYLAEDFINGVNLNTYMGMLIPEISAVNRSSPKCCGLSKTILEIIGLTLVNLYKLHNQNYVHRDLKPGNLMVIENSVNNELESQISAIKLIDFGGTDKRSGALRPAALGTAHYFAPELKTNADLVAFTKKSDIYAIGLSLLEILELIDSGVTNKVSLYFRQHPEYIQMKQELRRLFAAMMDPDKKNRLNAAQALASFIEICEKWHSTEVNFNVFPKLTASIIEREIPSLCLDKHLKNMEL